MADKGSHPLSLYISRSNSWFSRPFRIVALGIFLGFLVIWSFDGFSVRSNFRVWRNGGDYFGLNLHEPVSMALHHVPVLQVNLTDVTDPLSMNSSNLVVFTSNTTQHQDHDQDSSSTFLNVVAPSPSFTPETIETSLEWVSAELEVNFSSNLISRLSAPGGEPCHESETVEITIPQLDGRNSVELPAGEVHEFFFQALDDSGSKRCVGGDYFEIDLSGEAWKSRPPIKDFDNGSYSLKLQVHPGFVGNYSLNIILLYQHFEGLRFSPERFVYLKELRRIPITFYKSSAQLPQLQTCQRSDFARDVWSGRWTRHANNEKCEISNDGRYRCLEADFPCQKPWCIGSLGALESNGWVYSTHCSFQIFSADLAWECLQNRWIFFWGDSNHVDTIRNLITFVLGSREVPVFARRLDMNFTNPNNKSQMVRITNVYNGHWNATQNYQGLNSLQHEGYRNLLQKYFSEKTVPDTIIMNSGLHDGIHWKTLKAFVEGADYAVNFWEEVISSMKRRGLPAPKLLYRTTVAGGGYARRLGFNPSKMEAFNGVVLDKLKTAGILFGVVDDFDMTFPWHYDHRCNDGVHYGRKPAMAKWRDGKIGHQYFVDLMLGHVLLNYLCV